MRLNDFKKKQVVSELDASHLFGNYGAAALKQLGNRVMGNPKGQMSVKDRMAQDNFIRDFVGRASANIASGIQGGLINPNPGKTATPKTATQATQAKPTAPAVNQASVAKRKPARKTTPPATDTGSTKPVNPGSVKSELEPTPIQKSPAQIRQQKQAAAAEKAQAQMTPVSPEQSQAKAAGAQAFNNMAGGLEKMGNKPPATTASSGQLGPKGRATLARLGKQKQDRENSNQGSLDLNEDKFNALNAIFENIMGVDEAKVGYPDTISTYLQKMFNQYTKGAGSNDNKTQAKLKQLADQVMNTYGKDKGKAALNQLANFAFSLGYSHAGQPVNTATNATTAPTSAMDAIKKGVKQGLGMQSQTAPTEQGADSYKQILDLVKTLDPVTKKKLAVTLAKDVQSGDWKGRQPITIGKEKIMPDDPKYAQIMKNQPAMAESKKK